MQFRDRARHGVLAVFSSAIAVSCVVILLVASSDEVMYTVAIFVAFGHWSDLTFESLDQKKSSLEQGGSVTTTSTTAGTTSGEANIFFGVFHQY